MDKSWKKIVELRPKTYSYLKDIIYVCKKAKGTESCVIKRKLKFQDYKNSLKASQIINMVNFSEKKGINFDSLQQEKKRIHKK